MRLRATSLDGFVGAQSWRVRRAQYGLPAEVVALKLGDTAFAEAALPPAAIVACAERLLADSAVTYDLMAANCEAFAFHCVTGLPWRSHQSAMLPARGDAPAHLLRKLQHWGGKLLTTAAELLWVALAAFRAP